MRFRPGYLTIITSPIFCFKCYADGAFTIWFMYVHARVLSNFLSPRLWVELVYLLLSCRTDLRLNQPRYATLPNIMKAKSKVIKKFTPQDLNVEIKSDIEVVQVTEPPKRKAGVIVSSVDELVDKLKNEAHVIWSTFYSISCQKLINFIVSHQMVTALCMKHILLKNAITQIVIHFNKYINLSIALFFFFFFFPFLNNSFVFFITEISLCVQAIQHLYTRSIVFLYILKLKIRKTMQILEACVHSTSSWGRLVPELNKMHFQFPILFLGYLSSASSSPWL